MSAATRRPTGQPPKGGARKTGAARTAPSPKSAKRPAASHVRRNRVPVALAAVVAAVVLGTSFPLSTLLSQHHQLSAAAAQLRQVQSENRSLTEQQNQLNSQTAIDRLARQDYQLVSPGQTLYDVLPPSGQAGPTAAGSLASGDPGSRPPVAPADAPDMSPDPDLSSLPSTSGSTDPAGSTAGGSSRSGPAPASSGSGAATAHPGFWSRVTRTLEFWK